MNTLVMEISCDADDLAPCPRVPSRMRFPMAACGEPQISRARLALSIATSRRSKISVQSKSRPASNLVPRLVKQAR